jgi:hypothetical protein
MRELPLPDISDDDGLLKLDACVRIDNGMFWSLAVRD